jgi:hypothetical protein
LSLAASPQAQAVCIPIKQAWLWHSQLQPCQLQHRLLILTGWFPQCPLLQSNPWPNHGLPSRHCCTVSFPTCRVHASISNTKRHYCRSCLSAKVLISIFHMVMW